MLPARGPARHAAGHSLSRWPDSTRDHLPDPWQWGGSTPSSDCNARRAEPPNGKSDRLDQGELCEAAPSGSSRGNRGHGRIHAAPSFPGADRHESSSVSETVSVAGSARTHAHGWSGRHKCGLRGRIRKRQPIQPRIQPFLRPTTDAGYSGPSLAKRSAIGVGRSAVKRFPGNSTRACQAQRCGVEWVQMKKLLQTAGALLPLALAASTLPATAAVHIWDKQEVILTSARSWPNPYTDVTVFVDLTGPNFKKRIYGFWDGGQTFRVRVLATAPGTWTWRSGSNPPDQGLAGKTGTFVAID